MFKCVAHSRAEVFQRPYIRQKLDASKVFDMDVDEEMPTLPPEIKINMKLGKFHIFLVITSAKNILCPGFLCNTSFNSKLLMLRL